jgi:hypothetical protein
VRANIDRFTSRVQKLESDNSGQASALTVLEAQNRSQQNTINGFGSQLIKAVAQPLVITPLAFDQNNENVVHKRVRWIVLTNKAEPSQNVRMFCSQSVNVNSVVVLGGGMIGSNPRRIARDVWDANLGSPWTPTTPLLIDMSFGEQLTELTCTFVPR